VADLLAELQRWALNALPQFAGALVVLIAATVGWRVVSVPFSRALARSQLDPALASVLLTIARYTVIGMALIIAASQVGIHITPLLGGLGVAGLAVGLAVRDTVSNMVSGLIILWDRPFEIGDVISIDGAEGRVERIGLRSTHLRSADGARVIIPNSMISTTRITNRTAPGTTRLRIPITLTVDRDTPALGQALLGALRADPHVLPDPPPQLQIMEVNDWTVKVELWAWVRTADAETVRLRLHDQILTALRQTKESNPQG